MRHYLALVLASLAIAGLVGASTAHAVEEPPFDTVTQLSCGEFELRTTEEIPCKATVIDARPTKQAPPGGRVNFGTNGGGNFSDGATCLLEGNGTKDQGVCTVKFTPTAAGTFNVGATYVGGDGVHATSLVVISKKIVIGLPTSSQVECTPDTVAAGQPTSCLVFVADTSATPLLPGGGVGFTSSSAGTFNKACSPLLPTAFPFTSQCSVTYTPTAPVTATHTITIQYGGDFQGNFGHLRSSASTQVKVLGQKHPVKAEIACTPNPVDPGALTICKLTLTDTATGEAPVVPTGFINLTHTNVGTLTTAQCSLGSNGDGKSASCGFGYTPSAPGTHELKASYNGDDLHTGVNAATSVTARSPTATSMTCKPTSVILGGASACTVIVEDTFGTPTPPTGKVKFESSGAGGFSKAEGCDLFAIGAAKSRCQIIYTPTAVAGSPHAVKAKYQGDGTHQTSATEQPVAILAKNGGHQTTTAIDCKPGTVILGGAAVCTVDVTDVNGTPTAPSGEIVLASDGPGDSNPSSCQLFEIAPNKSRCQVLYKPFEVGSGTHVQTAIYPGDATHEPSVGTTPVIVLPANGGHHTSVSIACQPSPAEVGGTASCVATVTDTEGTGATVPGGSVFFASGQAGTYSPAGCTTLVPAGDGKSATCTVAYSPLAASTHAIKAVYSGDATHAPSEGATELAAQVVVHQTATTVLCTSPVEIGTASNCLVTVNDENTTKSSPAGEVKVSAQGTNLSCTLVATGNGKTSTCSVNYTPASVGSGTHTVSAAYQGTAKHQPSQASTTITVLDEGGANGHPTTTSISCNPTTVELAKTSQCTATVTDVAKIAPPTPPTGSVHFSPPSAGAGSFTPENCQLKADDNGKSASCETQVTYAPKTEGAQVLKGSYVKDAGHAASEGTTTLTVLDEGGANGHPTTTTISCEPSSTEVSKSTSCSATVKDVATVATPTTPTGQVQFSNLGGGSFSPGSCTLKAVGDGKSGTCESKVTYSPTEKGAHTLTAAYLKDAKHAASQGSTNLPVADEGGANGHPTTTAVTCNPNTVELSKTAQCTATVTDVATVATKAVPTGSITFSPPAGGGGSFSPASCSLKSNLDGKSASCETQVTYTPSAKGSQLLKGSYVKDAGHAASEGTTTLTVLDEGGANGHPTTTSISCNPTTVELAKTSKCTATVTDAAKVAPTTTPTGSVHFSSPDTGGGSFTPQNCTLKSDGNNKSATCEALVTYTPTVKVNQVLGATYLKDATHAASEGTTELTVLDEGGANGHPTTTAISCTPTTVEIVKAVQCTATVTDAAKVAPTTTPTGSVHFTAPATGGGPFSPENCQLKSDGNNRSASCETQVTYTPSAKGSQVLKASYVKDAGHAASEGTTTLTVLDEGGANGHPTTTTISCNPTAVELAKTSQCTATVTDAAVVATPTTPTGSVHFSPPTGLGSFAPENCALKSDGNGKSSSCELQATYTPTDKGSGTHTVRATYVKDATHAVSEATTNLTVLEEGGANGHPTQTTITCEPTTVELSKTASCTATVKDVAQVSPPSTPTGSVDFSTAAAGKFTPTSCQLAPSGDGKTANCQSQVTYAPEARGGGIHTLKASYVKDPAHAASEGTKNLTVLDEGGANGHPTTTTISCEPSTAELSKTSKCTATVTDVATVAPKTTPTGSVHFSPPSGGGGSFAPQNCALKSDGNSKSASCEAQVTYTPSAKGPQVLKATYLKDATHAASDGITELTVLDEGGANGHPTTAAISCSPTAVEVQKTTQCTATVTDTATVAPKTVPTGSVQFSPPAGGGGSFTPGSCALKSNLDGKSASCETSVAYKPTSRDSGFQVVKGSYVKDATHAASEGTTELTVLEEGASNGHPTETSIGCNPTTVEVSKTASCTASVTDLATTNVSAPTGSVHFTVPSGPGSLSPADCQLKPDGGGGTSSCEAQVTYAPKDVGTGKHRLRANYVKDATHAVSEATTELTVLDEGGANGHPTETAISCNPTSVEISKTTQCTATVTDTATVATKTVPTGSVDFSPPSGAGAGAFAPGSCVLKSNLDGKSASCEAPVTYTPSADGQGQRVLKATYVKDAKHAASEKTTTVTVLDEGGANGHPTTTSITCNPTTVELAKTSKCTATVTDLATAATKTTPTGSVNFSPPAGGGGAFTPGSCALKPDGNGSSASCEAEVTYAPSAQGSQVLKAAYVKDATHASSEKTTTVTVLDEGGANGHPTETTVSCQPSTVEVLKTAQCTATVKDVAQVASPRTPSGQVHFTAPDGLGSFASPNCQLKAAGDDKTASCEAKVLYTPSGKGSGKHAIHGAYLAGSNHATSEDEFELTVVDAGSGPAKHPIDLTLSCAPTNVTLGGASVCTVSVADRDGASVPGGQLQLSTSGGGEFVNLCNLAKSGPAKASCQAVYLPVAAGGQVLRASYGGDADHVAGEVTTTLQVGGPSGGDQVGASVDCSPSPVTLGGQAVCRVTVTDQAATPTVPGGLVVLASDGAGTFGNGGCVLFATDARTATCQILYTPTEVGTGIHTLSAIYSGDPGHRPATGNTELPVLAAGGGMPTVTGLRCEPARAVLGETTRCTATVENFGGPQSASMPTRAVIFASDSAGAFVPGGCELEADGTRALCHVDYTAKALGDGTQEITAVYMGDPGHEPSSGAATLTVVAPAAQPGPVQSAPPPPAVLAPNTKFAKRPRLPRRKSGLRKVRFRFLSDQPGSRFECKLDKRPFKPCRLPFKAKVRPGRHVFRVRAVNPQGMADPTPAIWRWKVVRHGAAKAPGAG